MESPSKVAAHILVSIQDFSASEISMSADAHHHFARVLRLKPGQAVSVTDGRGGIRSAVVSSSFASSGLLDATSEPSQLAARGGPIGIGLALAKGEKPELAVQKLTELAVDRIVLFQAEHSVARWDPDRAAKNIERLRSVSREALQQSRGCFLPSVEWADLQELSLETGVARADFGGSNPTLDWHRMVLIGPEGGWSKSERDLIPNAVTLASTVLRAETAAIVAAALCVALRERMVASMPTNRQ